MGREWDKGEKELKIKHPLKLEDFGHIVSHRVERITDGLKDPRINTYIERYNRTIQEESTDNNLDVVSKKPSFIGGWLII